MARGGDIIINGAPIRMTKIMPIAKIMMIKNRFKKFADWAFWTAPNVINALGMNGSARIALSLIHSKAWLLLVMLENNNAKAGEKQ